MSGKWDQLPRYTKEEVVALYGADMKGELGLDPKVVHGVLPNGITYYVRQNGEPQERAELRVVLKVGSILEDEGERGIAHLIEHLAFRGSKESTENFEIVKELESHGVSFGAHQNAYTSFDETVYELHVPTTNDELMYKSLHILRQLALEARLSDEDVDAERQIIIEEWRKSRNGGSRASESYFRLLTQGSKYADRLPIGLVEVIKSVTGETVRSFYDKYYTPQNMAVIAVGDFPDIDQIVQHIKDTFSLVVKPQAIPLPPRPEVPSHKEARIGVFTDPEVTSAAVGVDCKMPTRPLKTLADYRAGLVKDMLQSAINHRFKKRSLDPDPPFITAETYDSSVSITPIEGVAVGATAPINGLLTAFTAVLREMELVRRKGLSKRELEVVRENIRSDLLADWMERDQIPSLDLCDELVDLYLHDAAAPGLEEQVKLDFFLLQEITDDEIWRAMEDYNWGENCVVHVTLPEPKPFQFVKKFMGSTGQGGKDEEAVTEQALRRILTAASAAQAHGGPDEIEPVEEELFLPPVVHAAGKVVSYVRHEAFDIHELTLSNGLRVSYKPTHFQDDEVIFMGWAFGGLSELYDPTDKKLAALRSARWSEPLANQFGIFGVPPSQYTDIFTGVRASITTSIETYNRSLAGECSPQDLKMALHMIYLLFTSTIKPNQERLATIIRMTRERYENSSKSPESQFFELVDTVNSCSHPLCRRLSAKDITSFNADEALRFYRQSFRDPSQFRLVFVGNIPLAHFAELCEVYLASIPRPLDISETVPPRTRATVKTLDIEFPLKPVTKKLRLAMVDENCTLRVTFRCSIGDAVHGTHSSRARDFRNLQFAACIVERRLIEVLRFKMGHIYNVRVLLSFGISNPSVNPTDVCPGEFTVALSCEPDKVDFVADTIFEEIERLRLEGPTQEEVKAITEADRLNTETALRTNSWWAARMVECYHMARYTGDISECIEEDMARMKDLRDALSPEVASITLRRLVDTSRFTRLSMVPRNRRLVMAVRGAVALVGVTAVVWWLVSRQRKRRV